MASEITGNSSDHKIVPVQTPDGNEVSMRVISTSKDDTLLEPIVDNPNKVHDHIFTDSQTGNRTWITRDRYVDSDLNSKDTGVYERVSGIWVPKTSAEQDHTAAEPTSEAAVTKELFIEPELDAELNNTPQLEASAGLPVHNLSESEPESTDSPQSESSVSQTNVPLSGSSSDEALSNSAQE